MQHPAQLFANGIEKAQDPPRIVRQYLKLESRAIYYSRAEKKPCDLTRQAAG
jgi:hypothetical protein